MPINPNSIKAPAILTPRTYTPRGGTHHSLELGDSWASLATRVGVSPWDLVRFNFPHLPTDLQAASKEVNWYLEHYVFCTLLTSDNRNYRFSPPGKIWLPTPAAAAATPDQIAKALVLSVLRGPAIPQMTFGVGFLVISASDYESVAKAIESGKILVKSNPSLSNLAFYHGGANPPYIDLAPSVSDIGLIVHECTHAIFDIRKLTTNVGQSEGFGYLSQALYNLLRYGPQARYNVPYHAPIMSWVGWQVIFDESRRLAEKLKSNRWVSEDDAKALFSAFNLAQYAGYEHRVGNVELNDGI
jgi:hypothetical protein